MWVSTVRICPSIFGIDVTPSRSIRFITCRYLSFIPQPFFKTLTRDSVIQAFSCTHRVLTLSIHRYEPGFFPCSGAAQDVGFGRGRYHAVNVPLREGVDDAMFTRVFERIFWRAANQFRPEAIVVQVPSLMDKLATGFFIKEVKKGNVAQQFWEPFLCLGGLV